MGQILQADEAVGVLADDAFGNDMMSILLQPSLSPADDDESSGGGASAFLLQTLPQSRIMVGFGDNGFARMERLFCLRGSGHGQVAAANIHANDTGMALWCGVSSLQLQADEQVELLLGFVIPQFGGTNLGPLLYQCDMLRVPRIGHDHPPIQGQDTEVLFVFEAVVLLVLIGKCRRDVLGRFVQSLLAFLGLACLPMGSVLLDLRPERFVGSPNLTGDRAGHLRGQMKTGTHRIVGAILQEDAIATLAMRVSILAHIVQRIPIRQLRCPQCLELLRSRMQCELSRYHRFHASYSIKVSAACQDGKVVECFRCTRLGQFLPPTSTEAGGIARSR